ncbi:MAG: helix-turn-helix domain-containing protein [Gammaproteobacteria bacterium]
MAPIVGDCEVRKLRTTVIEGVEIEHGSDNIYADMGIPDAEKFRIKADLAIEITLAIRRLGLTQDAAARRMGIPQPRVSALMNGDFTNLSERKLMDCLTRLGYDVEIKLRPAREATGRLTVAMG